MNFDQRVYGLLHAKVDEGFGRRIAISALKAAPSVGRGAESLVHGAANIAKDTSKGFGKGVKKQVKRAGEWAGQGIRKNYSAFRKGLGQAVANKTSDMEATERVEKYTKALLKKNRKSKNDHPRLPG